MVRFQKSFSMKLEGKIDARVRAAYEDLENMAACAGIRENYDEAQIARMNHHGWVKTTKKGETIVPARRFVDAFANNAEFAEVGSEIKELIKENLNSPVSREWETQIRRSRQGGYAQVPTDISGTKPFGTQGVGARRLMNRIAHAMKDAQISVIGSPLLPRNADATIKRKKANAPLLDKGIMRASIRHWVEDAVSERMLEYVEAEGFE